MLPTRADMRGGPASKNRARRLRADMTDAERVLWQAIRKDQLGRRFHRQFRIPPFIVDFACIDARLVIECDGGQHAGSLGDARRGSYLRRQGWQVLRFWNNDILNNPDGVLQIIAEALRAAAYPHPNPPPLAGEGVIGRAPPLAAEGAMECASSQAGEGAAAMSGGRSPPPQAGEG